MCVQNFKFVVHGQETDKFVEAVSEKVQSIMSIFDADRDVGIDCDKEDAR